MKLVSNIRENGQYDPAIFNETSITWVSHVVKEERYQQTVDITLWRGCDVICNIYAYFSAVSQKKKYYFWQISSAVYDFRRARMVAKSTY
jgi:hypothetical protein